MTSTVVVTVTQETDTTKAVVSPSGKPQSRIRFSILDSTGAVSQFTDITTGLSASFSGVADGTYTASAQILDADGAALGEAQTTSFTAGGSVTPPAVTFQPLTGISVAVTPDAAPAPAAPAA